MEATAATKPSPRWLCHVCHFSSTEGSGYVCQHCFKIACGAHIIPTATKDENGATSLEMLCVECLAQTAPSAAGNMENRAMPEVEAEKSYEK
jgi:hypothetical protein